MITIADSCGYYLLPPVAIEVGQGKVFQMPGMPVLRDRLAIGIEDGYLIGPPGIMDTRNDDPGRLLLGCLQHAEGDTPIRGGCPVELRQVSSRRPTPFLITSIRIADERCRVRHGANGREIEEKNASMAVIIQISEPDARRYALFVIPVGRESFRKALAPKLLSFRIQNRKCRTVQAPGLGPAMRCQHSDGNVGHNA